MTAGMEDNLNVILDQLLASLKKFSSVVGIGSTLPRKGADEREIVVCVTQYFPLLQHVVKRTLKDLGRRLGRSSVEWESKTVFVRTGQVGHRPSINRSAYVQIGATIALAGDTEDGTLGGLLNDGTNQYLLTCRHVLDGTPGDTVVLRQLNGADQPIAKLTKLSKWSLGLDRPENRTDYALAGLDSTVETVPAPGCGLQIKPYPATSVPNDYQIVPLSKPYLDGVKIVETMRLRTVHFPTGQITLSDMWLLHSEGSNASLAEHGDSGAMWAFRAGNTLTPAAITVAVTEDWKRLLSDNGREKKEPAEESTENGTDQTGAPGVLVCPMVNIFEELQTPGLQFGSLG
jgi:hypothetical protein